MRSRRITASLEAAGIFAKNLPSRDAFELDLFGLRSWTLKRYPYVVFYVEHDRHIDVLRVLHGMRDLPASLGLDE